jgi:hypothetical protein
MPIFSNMLVIETELPVVLLALAWCSASVVGVGLELA